MKTLIIYGSRKGCTKECAEVLGAKGENVTVLDVNKAAYSNCDAYDTVIMGSSIWAGKIHRKMIRFIENNREKLLNKNIGLFICSGELADDHFSVNFPGDILAHAKARQFFGGKLDLNDFGPLMRWVLNKKAGVTASYDRVRRDVIDQFAGTMEV